MSRLIFDAHPRQQPPPAPKGAIAIEPPPELPRLVPPSLLRRALPYMIVILIVGMIIALFATGMRLISPQMLFFPFVLLLAATALYRGTDNKLRTEEIDAERADYLRYLAVIRENIRVRATQQRAALEWSHPDPRSLSVIPGTPRQWERDPHDPDVLVIRAGRHDVALDTALRVKDAADEIDLEPVSHAALRSLLDTQRTVRDAPRGIDFAKLSEITVTGDRDEVRASLRAWIAQAVTWHDPSVLTVAMASPDLDTASWSWLKWLPHTDIPGELDGAGPARYLSESYEDLDTVLAGLLGDRAPFSAATTDHPRKHVLMIVDDQQHNPECSAVTVPAAGLAGVTVVHLTDTAPDGDQYHDPERPILRIADGRIDLWQSGHWQRYVDTSDTLSVDEARHVARRLSRWDSNPAHAGLRSAANRGATFSALMGIEDASRLDVPALWSPRSRDDELRVPIGIDPSGRPLFFDLKDEAEGGMGPHGLMIGMTGSGKSQMLMAILLSLLATHSADRLIVIYADFKGEAGADIFRNFPQVVAIISNMAEKHSLADRFADTLRGEVARRERLLMEAGRQVQGSAFNSVAEYEAAIEGGQASGFDLPPIPTLFVVADEFSLMLADHPEYADLFDFVARKGRSFRIHILFASQTLDVGRIKDIDKNTSYRIGLKVASPAVSRQVIGVDDAYHIESGREHKGVGFLVPSPGAMPIKFRSVYVDGVYTPPRGKRTIVLRSTPTPQIFTAAPVEREPDTVIIKDPDTSSSHSPSPIPKKLIATIGDQLAQYGPRAPRLWLPPLDEPVALGALLARHPVPAATLCWPLGEIDRPFHMRRDPLVFDARSASGNAVIHGGPKSGKSTALKTFIMSAAALHTPREVTFYCLDYGGGQLRALADLAHVGSIASPLEDERIRRTFGELELLLASRQRLFREQNVVSVDQFRERRTVEPDLDDGFGEVFLVIDNLYAFSHDNTDPFNTRNPLLSKVTELVNAGLSYGIHVVITTPNWIEIPLAMRDGLGLRLELRLHDPQDSNVRTIGDVRRPAASVPDDQPGRGLTMAAEQMLIAAPRLDDVDSAEQLPEALGTAVDTINARHPSVTAPRVRLLPASLDPAQLGPLYPAPETVVIGQREDDLSALAVDFNASPLLMVLGDNKSGKSTLLRHLIRTLRENSTAEQVAFTVIDRRLHLLDEPLFPDNEYTPNLDRITPTMLGLSALVAARRPPAGLSTRELADWSARSRAMQRHYLIIDDIDQIPDGPAIAGPYVGQRPWTPLIDLLAEAGDLGLRVVVTGRAAGSGHSLMTNPLLRRLNELQSGILMLSGSPTDGGKTRGHRFMRLPPGRAMLLTDNDVPTFLQLINPLQVGRTVHGKEYPQ